MILETPIGMNANLQLFLSQIIVISMTIFIIWNWFHFDKIVSKESENFSFSELFVDGTLNLCLSKPGSIQKEIRSIQLPRA